MKKLTLTLAAAAMIGSTAQAAVLISSVPGSSTYSGPVPTYDFESPAPFTGGTVTTGSLAGTRTQPLGSTGNYASVGLADGSPGILDLSGFAAIDTISLLWGSVDKFNTLDVLSGSTVLASFAGSQVYVNGATNSAARNPIVTLTFSGSDRLAADGLRFSSGGNSFEVDNVAISAVPDAATWAMMIAGFGLVGGAIRRRKTRTTVSYA